VAPLLKGIAPLKKIHQLSECAALTLWFFLPLCSALLQRSSARVCVWEKVDVKNMFLTHRDGERCCCLFSYKWCGGVFEKTIYQNICVLYASVASIMIAHLKTCIFNIIGALYLILTPKTNSNIYFDWWFTYQLVIYWIRTKLFSLLTCLAFKSNELFYKRKNSHST